MRQTIAICASIIALLLTLSACTGLTDVLCRPAGHCPNAPDGVNKNH